jgi:hypothetical protein
VKDKCSVKEILDIPDKVEIGDGADKMNFFVEAHKHFDSKFKDRLDFSKEQDPSETIKELLKGAKHSELKNILAESKPKLNMFNFMKKKRKSTKRSKNKSKSDKSNFRHIEVIPPAKKTIEQLFRTKKYRYLFHPPQSKLKGIEKIQIFYHSTDEVQKFTTLDSGLQYLFSDMYFNFGYHDGMNEIFEDLCKMNILSEIWKIIHGYDRKPEEMEFPTIEKKVLNHELTKRSEDKFKNESEDKSEGNETKLDASIMKTSPPTKRIKEEQKDFLSFSCTKKYSIKCGNVTIYLSDCIPSDALKKDFPEFCKWIESIEIKR